jgi:hypothetical protein
MTVWKFSIPSPNALGWVDVPDVPAGAELVSVGFQDERMVLWARCDPSRSRSARRLIVVNTGQEVPLSGRSIGTAIHPVVGTVWHVFDDRT